ncbi:MAG: hypothetical protein C4326_07335 [Ignavibacteria bacterium]
MVLRDPRLINTSPYGDGWLLPIRPAKLHVQLNNAFTGRAAQQWLEYARQRLVPKRRCCTFITKVSRCDKPEWVFLEEIAVDVGIEMSYTGNNDGDFHRVERSRIASLIAPRLSYCGRSTLMKTAFSSSTAIAPDIW